MGGGSWSSEFYSSTNDEKIAEHGTAFVYDKVAKAEGRREAHASLDPKRKNKAGSIDREARDSDDHPESLPIAVIFDVTGSMGGIPVVLQTKLPQLHGMLMRKGGVAHPQLLFGAVGDATCDSVPLQVGEFESDNRGDEHLANLYLEHGGGGWNHESYQMAAYFLARHTKLDSLEKRGKKGYCFLIGDERVYSQVAPREVEAVVGETIQDGISTREIFEELKEKYEVFFLFAGDSPSYGSEARRGDTLDAKDDGTCMGWRELLGQHALILEHSDAVCETIAATIAMMEGGYSREEAVEHLKESGASHEHAEAAGRALATVGSVGGGTSVVPSGEFDVDGGGAAERI